ncbi:PAS domain-containing protein [Dongia sp.]|uniref:PAS domain-containing protein n=1 Tax=Dongia sp. TaxID=1977262 RepID=UPI0035B3EBD8
MSLRGTWEISFLVDKDGRILEGRGACAEHLGLSLQSVIGRSFFSFVAAGERSHLRRFIGQLNRPRAKRAALVSLQTPASLRSYAMEAQAGRTANDNWLMFSRDTSGADGLDDLDLPVVMADEGQFLRLVELAASQAQASLDLTTIEVGGLADTKRLSGLGDEEIAAFERSVGETLSDNAHDGILSNPSPGFYNLLHDPSRSGNAIAQGLTAVAAQHGISAQQAGIAHATMSVAPNTALSSIREALGIMQKRMPTQQSWEAPAKPKISEGQIAAALGIGAFLLGVAAIAVWLML